MYCYSDGLGLWPFGGGEQMSRADAERVVKQIFLEILEREPSQDSLRDPKRAGHYVDCLVKRHDKSLGERRFGPGTCSVDDIRTNVLNSEEYRQLQMRKAEAVYGAAPSGSDSSLPGAPGGGGVPGFSALGGIDLSRHWPYILGGVVLITLLKK